MHFVPALLTAIAMECAVLILASLKIVCVRTKYNYDVLLSIIILYNNTLGYSVWVSVFVPTTACMLSWLSASDEECKMGDLRLVGGVRNSSSGLLEVCANGVWGTVCDYRNEWSYENVAVVCHQLNLPTSSQ